jgi:hypothetical protein
MITKREATYYAAPDLAAYIPPRRIKRSRQRGARLPAGAIVCSRPTFLGNPFNWRSADLGMIPERIAKGYGTEEFIKWLNGQGVWVDGQIVNDYLPQRRQQVLDWLAAHQGQSGLILVCWCWPDDPCHVDEYIRRPSR